MTTQNLHVIGIDPGGTTGWCRLTVPRDTIFGEEPSKIVEWDHGEFTGPEPAQALDIAALARTTQSLDYACGPALVIEAWDIDPNFKSTDLETLSPVRLGAMMVLLRELTDRHYRRGAGANWLSDATVTFQSRTIAKETATNDRLKRWGLYVQGSDHVQDATRHAIVALRRAAADPDFAKVLWPC